MEGEVNVHQQVMEVVIRSPGCDLEEVVLECPNLTWNQVFLELDRLSRLGKVRLSQQAPGKHSFSPCTETASRLH